MKNLYVVIEHDVLDNFRRFVLVGRPSPDTVARLAPGESVVIDGRTFTNAGLVPGVGLVGVMATVFGDYDLCLFSSDGEEAEYPEVLRCYSTEGPQFAALWEASETFAPLREWCNEQCNEQ